jgi:hypothetical protein
VTLAYDFPDYIASKMLLSGCVGKAVVGRFTGAESFGKIRWTMRVGRATIAARKSGDKR